MKHTINTYLGLTQSETETECAARLRALAALPVRRWRAWARNAFFQQLAADRRAIFAACKRLRDDKLFSADFYVIEKAMLALESLRETCPPLPADAYGEGMGQPRIYRVAALLSAMPMNEAVLSKLMEAYQQISPLSMRELWALPDMLRLALIKRVRILLEKSARSKEAHVYRALQRCVADLRMLERWDNAECFESFSAVEHILTNDAVYACMDAPSRAYYRACVERIALRLHSTETAVAQNALSLCEGRTGRMGHVGYYLADEGEAELKAQLRPDRRFFVFPGNTRLALFMLTQAALLAALLLPAWGPYAPFLLLSAWSLANHAAVRLFLRLARRRFIPRMRVEDGAGVMVVIPTLIASENDLSGALENLETHYLSDPLPGAAFAVLGDFPDREAPADGPPPLSEEESRLLERARRAVEALNAKYQTDVFYFFHRKRSLHEPDKLYMGRERKRGALEDLMRLSLHGDASPFLLHTGELPPLTHLLTLDADTLLPRETLRSFVGAVRHPLNEPAIRDGRVVQGYGVIQPAMRSTCAGAAKSGFARIVAGDPGVDSYAAGVPEFYMDVFGAGIYGGKGILDIAVFAAISESIPPNSVLSHDLLESCFARAGFMGDVALYDAEPSNSLAWWKRAHRWIRGDWQLLPFLSRVDALGKYKILDNLRRSLTPVGTYLALLALPFAGGGYAAVLLLSLLIAPLTALFAALRGSFSGRYGQLRERRPVFGRALLDVMLLPYGAWRTLDAVCRTLYRLLFSHRHMLQWQTASQSGGRLRGAGAYWRVYWPCPLSGVLLLGAAFVGGSLLAIPFGLLWLLAPLCLRGLDKPPVQIPLGRTLRALLMEIALCTWRFFEIFANEETGFLPPDNVQEEPRKGPVMRSSPTNIGMAIASAVSALELGLTDGEALCLRLTRMLDTLENLPKWHGHLYNWYDLNTMTPCVPRYVSAVDSGNLAACLLMAEQAVRALASRGPSAADTEKIARRLRALAVQTDFTCLYDAKAHLFHIGYDAESGQLSPSHYDLLASEARLLSFVAIALRQVEQRHWFALGRLLTGTRMLSSWSGTLFEYLMPLILTGMTPDTLLANSCRGAVRAQMAAYSPWGVSESGYYAFDRRMYYQYAPFGLARLALSDKQDEHVIAPYAGLLALMVEPAAAAKNLFALRDMGMLGEYGMFEAVDFERSRTEGEPRIVRSYMAHHQGMGLCAIANALRDNILCRFFWQTPEARATRLLLEEKQPCSVPMRTLVKTQRAAPEKPHPPRQGRHGDFPETQLLTNGCYTVFCSETGMGYSRCGEVMLTRFRPRSNGGVMVLVRDGEDVWELTGGDSESEFESYKAAWRRTAGEVSARMQSCVSALRNGEVREITLTNHASAAKTLTLGVFFEVCLATQAQDMAHPAFQKLRVDAEAAEGALLYSRRPVPGETPVWLGVSLCGVQARYCTDRLVMPGRGRSYEAAMREALADTEPQAPIEPGFHARATVTLGPGDAVTARLLLCCAQSREAVCRELSALREEDAFAFARAYARSDLYFAGIEQGKADLYERMAGRVILRSPMKGALPMPAAAAAGVGGLWALGISGDVPILLQFCKTLAQARTARTLAAFTEYLAARGERCDVVIVGEYPNDYRNELRESLARLSAGVHVLHGYALSEEARALLRALCLLCVEGEQSLDRLFAPRNVARPTIVQLSAREDLAIDKPAWLSGMGGLDPDTHEYVIALGVREQTPLPWCNLFCNAGFGTLISERGGGYTWAENSRLGMLTPWHNDPVADVCTERLCCSAEGADWNLLRDDGAPLLVRHGFGQSVFISGARALRSELAVFVDVQKPVKYMLLRLSNPLMRSRRLQLRYEVDWRLGEMPHPEAIQTRETGAGALHAYNLREGRQGWMRVYGADARCGETGLGRATGVLYMDCALEAGETRTLLFSLGTAAGAPPDVAAARAARKAVEARWRERLSALRVQTGEVNLDAMLNDWLPYQLENSRLLGRTGYYQCGGAIGFRDQLQDALALKLVAPSRLRDHILLCAAMQFAQGDVLHWWHPAPDGEAVTGVRTRIRDDRLFLPYAVLEYLDVTGDTALLEESVPYLADAPLPGESRDLYARMETGEERASLYVHCQLAMQSVPTGAHGLCEMGGGDWNDAMDLVGAEGGESVWLSFFLLHILERFASVAENRGDQAFAADCRARALALREACEAAWDGGWYRRAYYADGTPLGSRQSTACAIDCISQAWAGICGAAHAGEAMDAMLAMLLDEEAGILKLLSPPFEPGDAHPAGYIQAYLPGVRENGGQYTHGACWAIPAARALGRGETAEKLFRMLLPITHADTPQGQKRYKGEPYVAAGDVYARTHAGRAGWTWYTGAAGWLYTAGIECVLGIRRRGAVLLVEPCFSKPFSFTYRYKTSLYQVKVRRGGEIPLSDDGKTHTVEL